MINSIIDRLLSPRLRAMIIKEIWANLRDPRSRIMLFVPPILQLVLFSAAVTLEVKHTKLGVLDHDGGAAATELINQLAGSPNIEALVRIESEDAASDAIDRQQVIGVVMIPQRYSADLAAGRPASIQAIMDGRKSNAAQLVANYIVQIAGNTGLTLTKLSQAPPPSSVTTVNWFNANLDYLWFIMPILVSNIGALSALAVSTLAVSRERELGSFDQLMVAPLRVWEIIAGKLVPPFIIGMINAAIYLAIVPLIFGVPFRGSIALYFLAYAGGVLSVLGIGLFVSVLSKTQQQSFLGQFIVIAPMFLTSGIASPVDNMPGWLQIAAQINPLLHFNKLMAGLYLKDMPLADVANDLWPLLMISAVSMVLAVQQFRARME